MIHKKYCVYRIKTLPVVRAGVHSCSPVAPQSNVKLFDGSTVTNGPAAECNVDEAFVRFPTKDDFKNTLYIKLLFKN